MDEFTFIANKTNRYYIWSAVAYIKTRRRCYFYRLYKKRTGDELFELELCLPKVKRVYSDEAFMYNAVYDKKFIQGKE